MTSSVAGYGNIAYGQGAYAGGQLVSVAATGDAITISSAAGYGNVAYGNVAYAGGLTVVTSDDGGTRAGFEMVGGAREVSIKPLLQRVMEARAPRVKPRKPAARKAAREIEYEAAELLSNKDTGGEQAFYLLMQQWLAFSPRLPQYAGVSAEQLFMAQVAMRIEQIRRFEQDEEDAVIALLMH